MNYSTQLDRAFVRQEVMETRDADAEAKRELWDIARKKEFDVDRLAFRRTFRHRRVTREEAKRFAESVNLGQLVK